MTSDWDVLGIPETSGVVEIRQAYARCLKVFRPDEDPEGFQRLRSAYESCLRMTSWQQDSDSIEPDNPFASSSGGPLSLPEEGSALSNPDRRASEIWNEFIQNGHAHTLRKLKKLFGNDDTLLNLEIREHFEYLAARYCARVDADFAISEALVHYFKWEENASRTRHPDFLVFAEALARYHALAFRQSMESMANGEDKASSELLKDTHPQSAAWILSDRHFIVRTRSLIDSIYWLHPESPGRTLNSETIAWWDKQVKAGRLTVQTVITSLLLGYAIFRLSTPLLPRGGSLIALLFCELSVGTLLAYLSFHRPVLLQSLEHKFTRLQGRFNALFAIGFYLLFVILMEFRIGQKLTVLLNAGFSMSGIWAYQSASYLYPLRKYLILLLSGLAGGTFLSIFKLTPLGYWASTAFILSMFFYFYFIIEHGHFFSRSDR